MADQIADGGNRLLRRAANLDVKGGARVVVFEEREKGLLGLLPETAIADVGDHADDAAIGLDVRATAPRDENTEGIAPALDSA